MGLQGSKPGGGRRHSTLCRITTFEYFVTASPVTIAMGAVGTAIFFGCVGYAVFEDKYGALDIGELTAPRKSEDIAAEQQARIEAESLDDTSPWNRRRRKPR